MKQIVLCYGIQYWGDVQKLDIFGRYVPQMGPHHNNWPKTTTLFLLLSDSEAFKTYKNKIKLYLRVYLTLSAPNLGFQ